ncbi:MAG: polysaccharide deacetylase family protein [Bacteroidetes bacterium]|nr:polysaccharide deacetylase family protein [Bacteroidota bacterium]
MQKLRIINILVVSLIIVLILANFWYRIPIDLYFIILVVYSFILFYGSYYIGSNFYLKTICSSTTLQKTIAISFDDGPVQNNTLEILQILKTENVKATFFCIGNRIAGNEEIVHKIIKEGHIIGNHSYSHHFWFSLFSVKKMKYELHQMDNELKRVVGFKPLLFRPPYGVTNPNLKKAVLSSNYITIGWSIRSMDTVIKNEKKLLNKICKQLKPGAIILFHDTSDTTLKVLPEFLKHVKSIGYSITPLDNLLKINPYE